MNLCQSIETLAMAHLDDELAPEEQRELELHLGECASCRSHLDRERAELSMVRKALVPPPAPDMLKARIARALDAEDKTAARDERKKWQRFILPGSGVIAAAAALLVFIGVGFQTAPAKKKEGAAVAHEVIRQETRSLPLEVQGPNTEPWLRQHFAAIEVPRFKANIQPIGARATAIRGYDAVMLRYLVDVDVNRVSLTAVVMFDLAPDELQGGVEVTVGNRTLHVYDADGQAAVTYVDEYRRGYVFTSERMKLEELLTIVGTSDLIQRAQQRIR